MNSFFKIALTLIVLAGIVSGCGSQNREVVLAWKFEPGSSYRFDYTTSVSSRAYENDQPVYANDTTIELEYDQDVIELIDNDRGKCRYNYTDKISGEKWSNQFIIASNGEITDILADSSVDNRSVDYYRRLFEQASPEFPEKPVKEGFEWSNDIKVLLDDGTTTAKTDYRVKSFVNELGFECAVIEYNGTLLIPIDSNGPDNNGVTTVGHDRFDTKGTIYFAYDKGIIIKQVESGKMIRTAKVSRENKNIDFRLEEDRNFTSQIVL